MAEFKEGEIDGVIVRKLVRSTDSRGWLTELFRDDDLSEEFQPVMAYISSTVPGVTRGPHEHVDQADLFCFIGPSTFQLRLWDSRDDSRTSGNVDTLLVGQDNPVSVLVPKGVIHAYKNIGDVEGIVINCPNRLYAGVGKKESVDEIRHENDASSKYLMD